jgi:hypothetical protein
MTVFSSRLQGKVRHRIPIQRLCAALAEKGENIDEDIASLVKKGLSPLLQRALNAVRVIGNQAVHPGTLDLEDDRDTATKLFDLVNIIPEQMISNPGARFSVFKG